MLTALHYSNNVFLSSEKEPKNVHLQRVLGPIQYKWREIGEALEIHDGRIQSIDHDACYNDTNKLSKVLQTWINTQPSDVTWRNIINVITKHSVNEPVLAKTITDFLANPNISEHYIEHPSKSIVGKICQG